MTMPDPLLTVREAALMMGFKEGKERFVRRLIEERRIEFIHVGRHVRIRESVVRAYLEAGTVHPIIMRRRLGVAA
jgi:excisionase family DNA binding protein